MKLNRKTSPRLFQEECLAVWVYERRKTGALTMSPSELHVLLAKLTYRSENWWAMKLRNVASSRGDSPPSGNDRNMAELRKAEQLRLSAPMELVSESMGAFREKPTEQDFGALFGEGVPYVENVERIGAPTPANGGHGQPKPMSTYLDEYKAYVEGGTYDELYKWQIARTVQENWDLEAEDLAAMIDRSFSHKHQNLWSGQNFLPKRMLMQWASRDPEDCRSALRRLLHGEAPLPDRMRGFGEHALRSLQAARPDKVLSTYQDTRAMSLWLGMVLPEKYYLYKSSTVAGFIERTGHAPLPKPGDKYTNIDGYYRLCEEVRELLLKRPDIIEAHRAIRDPDCHPDPEHHLLVQDIIYFVGEYNNKGQSNEDMDKKEAAFLQTLRKFDPEEQRHFLDDLVALLGALGVGSGDERVVFHAVPDVPRLGFTIGQTYCMQLGTDEGPQYGFAVQKKGNLPGVTYRDEFKGMNARVFAYSTEHQRVREHWEEMLALCQKELARTDHSGQRNKNNPFLEKAVFDAAYRASILGRTTTTEHGSASMSLRPSLNTIFYGPPGTGKTYGVFRNAVMRAYGLDAEAMAAQYPNDPAVMAAFDKLLIKDWKSEGERIAFVTFHQAFSYEDFVEGVKPKAEPNGTVSYSVEPGIFKRIVSRAMDNWLMSRQSIRSATFEDALEQLKDAWERDKDMKFAMRTKGYEFSILGFTETSIQFKKASGGTGHTLSLATLRDLYYEQRELKDAGLDIYYPGVIDKLRSFSGGNRTTGSLQNYVLVIDEINRANVSAVLGELITLLEPDKRRGADNHLEVMLPYSKEPFSIPPNLHIIGTMNTADRSVEALDTALRRRFSFEEFPSQHELLRNTMVRTVDLADLLRIMNARIEMLLDRDHQIGHSYFMNWAKGVDQEEKLRAVFKNNVIPLLQEYFYGDPVKVALVLGPHFVKEDSGDRVGFARKVKGGEDIEAKLRYTFQDPLARAEDQSYVIPFEAFELMSRGE
jgi:5-methylcytosine-specific restriction protein B